MFIKINKGILRTDSDNIVWRSGVFFELWLVGFNMLGNYVVVLFSADVRQNYTEESYKMDAWSTFNNCFLFLFSTLLRSRRKVYYISKNILLTAISKRKGLVAWDSLISPTISWLELQFLSFFSRRHTNLYRGIPWNG